MRPLTERLSPTISVIVIGSALIFAFYAVVKQVRPFVDTHLTLNHAALTGPEPWQLVSALFVHVEPWSLFFNLLGVWFVGAAIERELGRQRFLVLFFVPAVVAHTLMAVALWLTGTGYEYRVAGSSMAVLALFVVFGKLYGRTPARVFGSLVLEARTLTLILIGFALVADLSRPDLIAFGGDVVAIAVAFGLAGRRGAGLEDLFRRPGGKPRRRLEVVDGGQRGKPKDRRASYLN